MYNSTIRIDLGGIGGKRFTTDICAYSEFLDFKKKWLTQFWERCQKFRQRALFPDIHEAIFDQR
jgi:hypothetical protein